MDDLQTILDGLDAIEEGYVWEKSRNPTWKISRILDSLGVSKASFYARYDEARREWLEEVARLIRRNREFEADKLIMEHLVEAVLVTIEVMKDTTVKTPERLRASRTLIEYAMGTPKQRVDHTTDGMPFGVQWVEPLSDEDEVGVGEDEL